MIVLFDKEKIVINVRAGALEAYTPSDEIKEVTEKSEVLRTKLEAKHKEMSEVYNKFLKEEINPVKLEIQKTVLEINQKNNPELKAL